ncbi:alpha-hydroxy-acid oxidizing protein [Brucella intermedia GD04153]|uniref:Alpha-hydroxy-acid oxidizing protein n=1 Tax=Brucella intermedia GD04153 TaxID=2975438 RepID=A0AA42KPN3_9HYPH|nr:alpha-hydroxy acid oxidase [Brucella intermedia]MDH0127104.1 alpha-hydroxy-acid oxidizing protein [Brucella intermedia GD04153]
MSEKLSMKAAAVSDLREIARRRIPKWIFDYVDGGSYEELTLSANRRDLDALSFDQRVLENVSTRNKETTLAGQETKLPLIIAPTGLAGFVHPHGEIHAAKAAEAMGIPYCLSTVSICSIEDVAAETSVPFWFQLYIMRDRVATLTLIERAQRAGCSTLVVTLDLPIQAQRHMDIRNGLKIPMRFDLRQLLEMATKPGWTLGTVAANRYQFGNLTDLVGKSTGMSSFARWVAESFDPSVTEDDIAWVRKHWKGKLVLKGIMSVRDAQKAKRAGADAIVVSNHGGRQLDGARSSILALGEIASQKGIPEILFDSGVRTGQDVLKALASGARGAMIGRAHLYGLGAAGEAGVRRCIQILAAELDVSMALTGQTDVSRISAEILIPNLHHGKAADQVSEKNGVGLPRATAIA